jgi:type IV pilus assembly protein PilE
MSAPRRARIRARRAPRQTGFTLIELMIAVVVLGILATVAYPQYTEFVMRSRIIEATAGMNDFRTRMEQYFHDNRTYADAGNCGLGDPAVTADSSFQIACTGASANGYQLDATGLASKGMGSFQYRLVVGAGGVQRTTVSVDSGRNWSLPAPNTCWAVRKSGKCS